MDKTDQGKRRVVSATICIMIIFVVAAAVFCTVTICSFYNNRYVYLAVGDSITFGEGNDGKSYADIIADEHNDVCLEKIALGGLRAKELVVYANNGYLDVDKTPNLVTLFVGTNDYGTEISLDEFENSVDSLISIVKKQFPNSRIVFITPLYRDYFGDRTNIISGMVNKIGISLYEYRDIIKKKASEQGLEIYELTEDEFINKDNLRELTYDGLHPNKKGYKLIADRVYSDLIR